MAVELFRVDNEGLASMVCAVAVGTIGPARRRSDLRFNFGNVGDIHRFVRSRVDYIADRSADDQRIRAPWVTLREGRGDCKSTAVLIYALADIAGFPAWLRFYDQRGHGWDHVVAVVDGIPVDPLLELGDQVAAVSIRDVYI